VELDAIAVQVIVGALLPILVGLVTKKVAHAGVKAVLLLLLSAASGLIVQSTNGDGAVISKDALILAAEGWAIAVAMHFGFWRPTTVSDRLLPSVGIGGPPPAP
jgi:hypothetical protein